MLQVHQRECSKDNEARKQGGFKICDHGMLMRSQKAVLPREWCRCSCLCGNLGLKAGG